MWTSKNRARYDRSKLRYPSDLTDDEWGLVEPLIPPGKTGSGKRTVIMREVRERPHVHSLYRLSVGERSRKTCRRKSSVYGYFDLWTYDGTLERIHYALYEQCREREQRGSSPTAAIIDSQSVKKRGKRGACIDPHGYDAGQEAAHSCRYSRPPAPRHRSSGRHSKIAMEAFSSWRHCLACFHF